MDRFKYHIDVFWSDEDGGYIADVPDLEYCSAFGETYEEALREVLVAMELHIEVLEEMGRPVPEPSTAREPPWTALDQAGPAEQATRTPQQQGEGQQRAFEALAQESASIYADFLNSALSLYQQALQQATQVAQSSLQAAGQSAQSSAQAAQQTTQAANQVAQQSAQAASQAAQQSAESARQATRSTTSNR